MKRLTRTQIIQKDFIENRSRLIDLAAFLDRVERSADSEVESDFRLESLHRAISELIRGGTDRVYRVQAILSDQSILLLDEGKKNQSASGAPKNQCC